MRLQRVSRALDELFAARAQKTEATSAVAGIVLDGELVYESSFGMLDATTSARPNSDTLFRIGSLSKSFAATSIIQLRDEGKLALDEPAMTYVPELDKVRGTQAGWRPITIRHLLTMTSGLAYDDTWGPVSYGFDRQELKRLFDDGVTLASEPGARYAYSNLGYALLGLVVERVSGQSFRDYVSRHVLSPLGMSSTGWAPAESGMAIGYFRKKDGTFVAEPHPNDGVFAPAGGVYSTLHDLSRYVAFQLAAYDSSTPVEAAPLLRASVREMHRGQASLRWGHDVPVASYDEEKGLKLMTSSYGFGWVENTTCDYEGIVQHGGFEPGYFAYIRLLPRHRIGLVTLSTTAATGDYQTFRGVLGLLKEEGLLGAGQPPTPELLKARLAVDRLLAHWDDAQGRALFDPGSLKYSFFANVGEDLQRLARDHGACETDGELAASSATQASWRLRCAHGAIDFSLWLNPATVPRVQHLTWKEYAQDVPAPPVPNAPCQGP